MSTTLSFETGPAQLALKQCAGVEQAPAITVQLHATGDARIYTADGQPLLDGRWVMTITSAQVQESATLSYGTQGDRPLCSIWVNKSPQRFAILLDMFKGGNASEITVGVEGMAEMADYSRKWDTRAFPVLGVSSVCFDFPLPQSED